MFPKINLLFDSLRCGSEYLQDPRFTLITDSTELQQIINTLGKSHSLFLHFIDAEDVTGALVDIKDGDYKEIWLTNYKQPYSVESVFICGKYTE